MKTLAISALAGFISWMFGLALQATVPFDPGNLLQFGALGAVLAWFMWSVIPRMKSLEDAWDRCARGQNLQALAAAQVLDALGHRNAASQIKQSAEANLLEIDAAEKERKK